MSSWVDRKSYWQVDLLTKPNDIFRTMGKLSKCPVYSIPKKGTIRGNSMLTTEMKKLDSTVELNDQRWISNGR